MSKSEIERENVAMATARVQAASPATEPAPTTVSASPLDSRYARSPYSSASHDRQPSHYWTPESVVPSTQVKSLNGVVGPVAIPSGPCPDDTLPAASGGHPDPALASAEPYVTTTTVVVACPPPVSPSTTTVRPSSVAVSPCCIRADFVQDPSLLDRNPFGGQRSVEIKESVRTEEITAPSSSLSPMSASIAQPLSRQHGRQPSTKCWIEVGILSLVAVAVVSILCSTILAAMALAEFDDCGELADNAPLTLQLWLFIHAIGTGVIMLGLVLMFFGPRGATISTLLIIWYILSETLVLVWQIFGGIIFRISQARDMCPEIIVDKCTAVFVLASLHVFCCIILPAALRSCDTQANVPERANIKH